MRMPRPATGSATLNTLARLNTPADEVPGLSGQRQVRATLDRRGSLQNGQWLSPIMVHWCLGLADKSVCH